MSLIKKDNFFLQNGLIMRNRDYSFLFIFEYIQYGDPSINKYYLFGKKLTHIKCCESNSH